MCILDNVYYATVDRFSAVENQSTVAFKYSATFTVLNDSVIMFYDICNNARFHIQKAQ